MSGACLVRSDCSLIISSGMKLTDRQRRRAPHLHLPIIAGLYDRHAARHQEGVNLSRQRPRREADRRHGVRLPDHQGRGRAARFGGLSQARREGACVCAVQLGQAAIEQAIRIMDGGILPCAAPWR